MTQPTPRERIENLWDRATPVAPLLNDYRADVLREAADAIEQAAGDMTRFRGSQIAAELRRMAEEARS
jgi:hypothetical protein